MFLRLRATQLLKNHALIEDADLAYEVLLAKLRDHCYGQIAESIKQSIGRFIYTIFPNLQIVLRIEYIQKQEILCLQAAFHTQNRGIRSALYIVIRSELTLI